MGKSAGTATGLRGLEWRPASGPAIAERLSQLAQRRCLLAVPLRGSFPRLGPRAGLS